MARRLPVLRPDRYMVVGPPKSLAHRAGHAWEQALLPRRAAGCALIYSPANLAPAASRRNVVVIHDAAALRHPEAYTRGYVAYQRRLLPWIARHARLVITVSEFSRDELVEVLGLDAQRVKVIPEGVEERFDPDLDARPARRALGLTRRYVLAVATASARKNLEALEPLALTLRGHGIELLVAGSDRGYLRGGETHLRRLGYVDDSLLPGLYAGALALVMPSRYEGFGLPCLEAMASGVPVVAARAGALPETVGDAGLLVDAESDELTEAVLAAVHDNELRSKLIAAGLRRAASYSWARTARRTDSAIAGLLTDA
jgi:glycosyltransferase involved in cell wall biosynthesis